MIFITICVQGDSNHHNHHYKVVANKYNDDVSKMICMMIYLSMHQHARKRLLDLETCLKNSACVQKLNVAIL